MTTWPIQWRRLRRQTGGALAALYLLVFALAAAGHAHQSAPGECESRSSAGQASAWLTCESPEADDAESCPLCDTQVSQPAHFNQPPIELVSAPAHPCLSTPTVLGLRQAHLRLSRPRGPPSLTQSTPQSV